MLKSVSLLLLALAGIAQAAPFGGRASMSGPGGFQAGGRVSVDDQLKGVKASFYLFAPDSWVNAWNNIPEEGQRCILETANDPANKATFQSDDASQAKQLFQSKCSAQSEQINAFIDATQATLQSLPAQFVSDAKAWGQQLQQIGESFKGQAQSFGNQAQSSGQSFGNQAQQSGQQFGNQVQQGAQAGAQFGGQNAQQGAGAFKGLITAFAKATAEFFGKIAALSEQDRQQISSAFPKLQPFFSGPNSVDFLNQLQQLYTSIGNGDYSSIKSQGQQLKTTMQSIWQQYSTQNADGLQQASQILGKDLSKFGNFLQNNGASNFASAGQAGGFGQIAQQHPDLANAFSGENDDGNDINGKHSFNGAASANQNGGSFNAEAH